METLRRDVTPIRMRNYGRIIQDMITVAMHEEDVAQREQMTLYIAQCMRQKNIIWNKDQDISLNRVKDDIIKLSDGQLSCDFPAFEEILQRSSQIQNKMMNSKKK